MAPYFLSGRYGGTIFIEPDSSSSSGGASAGAFFFRFIEHFPIDVPDGPSGSVLNLDVRINGTCSSSSIATTYDGTYPTVSSRMGVCIVLATLDSAIVLVMQIKITILNGKLTSSLAYADNNLSLIFKIMN